MKKNVFASKTMWGFGLTAVIAVAQVFGVTYSEHAVTQVTQVLTALFGAYGLRDAVDKK